MTGSMPFLTTASRPSFESRPTQAGRQVRRLPYDFRPCVLRGLRQLCANQDRPTMWRLARITPPWQRGYGWIFMRRDAVFPRASRRAHRGGQRRRSGRR
jgi:hypothetical protein